MFTRFLFWIFLVFPAIASAKDMGSAEFKAKGNLGIIIHGEGGKVTGDFKREGNTIVGGRFSVPVASFKTGMDLRDEHVQDHTEAKKFPHIHFTLDSFEMKDGPVNGELVFHGVARKIVDWIAEVDGNKVTIKGKILLADYGIKPPVYLGVGISNELAIIVKLVL